MPTCEICHGDAFELLEQLPDDFAQVAVIDYPWTFINQDRPGRASHTNDEDWQMADNGDISHILESVRRVVVDGGYVFVFADDDVLPDFRLAVESILTYRKTLVWSTERIGNGHYFRSCHQYVICATVGETDRYVQSTPTVLKHAAPQREPGESPQYPTEKPAPLYYDLLKETTKEGERILEPFCGSAPGLEVAKSLGCNYWGCDVSDDALKRAKTRKEQTTLDAV